MHINPDHFLQTEHGRVITPELNKLAWSRCYEVFARELSTAGAAATVYVLVGPQGAGKSAWARAFSARNPAAIIFDAILVKRLERAPILEAVREHSAAAVAVWFRTSLEDCIARNAARPTDEVVPERNIRNVHAALEPPTREEGFDKILEVV
jgi:predicted kinase